MTFRLLISLLALFLSFGARADTTNNGTFRFLTQSLPDGTTNAQYAARFITANADGPVTFTAGSPLPEGLSLDPLSGFLTGIPGEVTNGSITVVANDTTQQIQFNVPLKISAAGGGGNSGASFANTSLANGRVGQVYAAQLAIAAGVGPFTYGAQNLPPGISLNGLTGAISGVPTAPGRYYVTLSAYDDGEDNNSATVLPILIHPSGSDFQFTTQALINGEVGTPFHDAYLVANAVGAVSFTASGLPEGLTLDPATGVVSGTPTTPGSFEVHISATDTQGTITSNLGMIIAPSASSHFYWNVFSLPPGLLNISYDRQPPLTAAAVNGTDVTYSAEGLPPGILYHTTSGELSGTPTAVGEYDTLFTATSTSPAQAITFRFRFVILPPSGGDINSVPVNFWLTREKLTLGEDGFEGWNGTLLFNADRRTGNRFDPVTDHLTLSVGNRVLSVPPGTFLGINSLRYASPVGQLPIESLRLLLSKQSLVWKTRRDTIDATVPGPQVVALTLGSQVYRTTVLFDERGKANAFASARPCFVLANGSMRIRDAAPDTATFSMLLSNPSFLFETGDTLRIRLLQDSTVLMDRDFTALGAVKQTTRRDGTVVYVLKKALADAATVDRILRFTYNSFTGKLSLALTGLDLDSLAAGQAHVTIELTIRDRIYTTGVTFFGSNPGRYSLPIR